MFGIGFILVIDVYGYVVFFFLLYCLVWFGLWIVVFGVFFKMLVFYFVCVLGVNVVLFFFDGWDVWIVLSLGKLLILNSGFEVVYFCNILFWGGNVGWSGFDFFLVNDLNIIWWRLRRLLLDEDWGV